MASIAALKESCGCLSSRRRISAKPIQVNALAQPQASVPRAQVERRRLFSSAQHDGGKQHPDDSQLIADAVEPLSRDGGSGDSSSGGMGASGGVRVRRRSAAGRNGVGSSNSGGGECRERRAPGGGRNRGRDDTDRADWAEGRGPGRREERRASGRVRDDGDHVRAEPGEARGAPSGAGAYATTRRGTGGQGAGSTGASASVERPARRLPLLPALPVVRANDVDKGTFFHGSTFKAVGASTEVVVALRELGITRPSHVQAEAYKLLLGKESRRRHVAIMDQAGSGKTLAYLLPLMQQLRAEEEASDAPRTLAAPRCPRLVVIAPTTELAQQVQRVIKALSAAGLRCRSACMTGGDEERKARHKSWRTQAAQLEGGLDVLVATPGRLLAHLSSGTASLSGARAMVLDEVDVLLGDQAAFREQVEPLRSAGPPGLRFVLATATLPQHMLAQLEADFPQIALAMGPGLHRTAAGLEEELVDCSGGDDISLESGNQRKLDALSQALARRGADRVLIFCNKIENCRSVENHLRRADVGGAKCKVLAYHEAIRDDLRQRALHEFLQPSTPGAPPLAMVCTDRMSRGIDCMYCEHVVLFDFPRDPSEYVRRVGRTARGAGGKGTVSALVLGRQVPLAREIMAKNQKGMPIHRVPEVE